MQSSTFSSSQLGEKERRRRRRTTTISTYMKRANYSEEERVEKAKMQRSFDDHQSDDTRVTQHRPSAPIETPLPEVITGREKLKRHQLEVAGQVWIPDIWGQEDLLKDWIDCSAFDSSLVPNGIMSARAALVQEGLRANSSRCVKS